MRAAASEQETGHDDRYKWSRWRTPWLPRSCCPSVCPDQNPSRSWKGSL